MEVKLATFQKALRVDHLSKGFEGNKEVTKKKEKDTAHHRPIIARAPPACVSPRSSEPCSSARILRGVDQYQVPWPGIPWLAFEPLAGI